MSNICVEILTDSDRDRLAAAVERYCNGRGIKIISIHYSHAMTTNPYIRDYSAMIIYTGV